MTLEQIITLALDKGGVVGVALLALWLLNESWKLRTADVKHYAEQYRGDAILMREVLKENTEAITKLMERLAK